MICPYCGKENADSAILCNYCGGSLVVAKQKSIPVASPPEPSVNVTPPAPQPQVTYPAPIQAQAPRLAPIQPPPSPSISGHRKRVWWLVGCLVLIGLILGCAILVWGLYSYTDVLTFLHPATLTPTVTPTSTPTNTPTTTNTPTATFTPTPTNTPTVTPSPTPSPTPIPTFTTTPNPILSSPGVLFYDDFSDPNSGWDRVNKADFVTDYYNNTYRITTNTDMSDSWANPDNLSFGDVAIEVDATKNGGPDDNDFGVICRYKSLDQFYYGVISSDGYYAIIKVTTDGSQTLGRDHLDYSDYINRGFTTNHIRFECNGHVLTLIVNGHQLDQQSDSDYNSGNVGLLAGTYSTPGTDMLFDNFIVVQP